VLNPQGGDVIQAMKSGILEVADVLVVNKSDLGTAQRMVNDLVAIMTLRSVGSWVPPVIPVSVLQDSGLDTFNAALAGHALATSRTDTDKRRDLRSYGLRSALIARIDELLTSYPDVVWDGRLADVQARLLRDLTRAGSGSEN
jgi:LAO/AO transport system kinase